MPLLLLLHLFGLLTSLLRFSDAPPAGDPPAGDPPAGDPPAADDDQDVGKLKEALRKERENSKNFKALQREAEELRKFKQEQEQAKLTEAEKVAAREKAAADKEAQLTQRERTMAVRDGLAAAATTEKLTLVANTATVIRLLDLDDVEFDDDGNAKNLGALLKRLAKDEPALFDQRKRPGSADAGARSEGAANVGTGINRLRAAYGNAEQRR